MKTNIHLWSYLAQFCLEWDIFQTKSVKKIETRFMSNNLLWKFVPFMRYCGKILEPERQYGACALHTGNYGYKHTLRLFNTHCFSAATVVERMRLKVTLHILCLCCWNKLYSQSFHSLRVNNALKMKNFHLLMAFFRRTIWPSRS